MQLELITQTKDFDKLSKEWNQLLTSQCASHVPFLRHEYLRAWWEELGGGEWENGELCIITGRSESGKLVAIAPLFFTENDNGLAGLYFIGSTEISDYLDLIAPREILSEFSLAFLDFLNRESPYPWQKIELNNILESSPSIMAIKNAAAEIGLAVEEHKLQHCPYIALPHDWESYLAQVKKKQRHEIRRKMRRAQEYEAPIRWYIVEDEKYLDQEIDAFFDLMSQDKQKELFLKQAMRSQLRMIIHNAFQAGWLQLSFLEIGGEKAASYLNFDFAGDIWVYNSGLNFKYRDLSPGWVLLGYLIEWAINNGRANFDFMRGDEAYKYRFGAIDRFILQLKIWRN